MNRRLSHLIALACMMFAGVLAWPSHAHGVRLDAHAVQQGGVTFTDQMWAYHDRDGSLTLDQIITPEYAAQFARVAGVFNAGSMQGVWWLRVELDVAADATSGWWLQLVTGYTPHVEVWLPRAEDAGWQHYRLGRLNPSTAWGIEVPHAPTALAALPAGRSTAWLRLSGSQPLSLKGGLRTEPSAIRYLVQMSDGYTAAFTIVAMLALVALSIGMTQRDGHFLAFAAHLSVMSLSVFRDTSLVSLLPMESATRQILYAMLPGVGLVTGAYMGYRLLELRTEFARVAVGVRVLMGIGLLLAFVGAWGDARLTWYTVRAAGMLMDGLFLLLAVVRVWRGVPLAVWPLVAYMAGGGSNIVFSLHSFGLVDAMDQVGGVLRFAPLVFAVSVVSYLGQRTLRIERAARSAHLRALEDSRAANEKLDATVAERTRELRIENVERRRAEHRLKRALREQRNFLSMVSHEFRTPLTIIDACAQLVLHDRTIVAGSGTQRELEKVRRATRRMVDLVDSLLTDDRLDASAMYLRRSHFGLVTLLGDIRERYAQVSEHRIELRASDAPLPVFADESLLGILFHNLLDNAVKHAPAGTPIEIGVACDGDDIVVGIRDHGTGIRAEDVERIFERYYRAPSAVKRPGLGLGLHIVHRIAELHDGSITVSNADGGGARFELRLPLEALKSPITNHARAAR